MSRGRTHSVKVIAQGIRRLILCSALRFPCWHRLQGWRTRRAAPLETVPEALTQVPYPVVRHWRREWPGFRAAQALRLRALIPVWL